MGNILWMEQFKRRKSCTLGSHGLLFVFNCIAVSGVARALPGGRLAHPEGQNEEEHEKSLRKNKKTWSRFEEKWGKWNSCPPGTVRLATALVVIMSIHEQIADWKYYMIVGLYLLHIYTISYEQIADWKYYMIVGLYLGHIYTLGPKQMHDLAVTCESRHLQ